MALASTITWEIRPSGSDTNGGGFKTGASGTDWSIQDAAQYSITDAVTAGTTTITSASASFGTDVVGNVLYITGGTGSIAAGWYEITSRTNSTTIVVDRSTGLSAGTGATLKIGGGFASLGQVGLVGVGGNNCFIKSGSYNVTTATANVSGGPLTWTATVADKSLSFFSGYNTNRNHQNRDTTKPVFTCTGGSFYNVFECSGAPQNFACRNIEISGGAQSNITCFKLYGSFGGVRGIFLKASSCSIGFDIGLNSRMFNCEATSCTTYHFYSGGTMGMALGCYAHDGTGDGFVGSNDTHWSHCIADTVGKGFHDISTAYMSCDHCTAYGCTSDGFKFDSAAGRNHTAYNCIADSNGGWGFTGSTPSASIFLINCAYRNNTSGNVDTTNITTPEEGSILLTANPFTDGPNGDFSLNNTAGGGAAIKGQALPATFLGSITTSYLDIGANQHQDPTGGTTIINGSSGVIGE